MVCKTFITLFTDKVLFFCQFCSDAGLCGCPGTNSTAHFTALVNTLLLCNMKFQ